MIRPLMRKDFGIWFWFVELYVKFLVLSTDYIPRWVLQVVGRGGVTVVVSINLMFWPLKYESVEKGSGSFMLRYTIMLRMGRVTDGKVKCPITIVILKCLIYDDIHWTVLDWIFLGSQVDLS